MPRRNLFSSVEWKFLVEFPMEDTAFIQHYTLTEQDTSIIKQHRGEHNRLGFAIQLCCLRYPGISLTVSDHLPEALLNFVAKQINTPASCWEKYSKRDQTRREHLVEIQRLFQFQSFSVDKKKESVEFLTELALQTNKGLVLAKTLIDELRRQKVILPSMSTMESMCAQAITQADRHIYEILIEPLNNHQLQQLDQLLQIKPSQKISLLAWLQQPPGSAIAKHILQHIERLKTVEEFNLPIGLEKKIHQNRLLKLAREGSQMTAQHLRDFEPLRRYGTLTALLLEIRATLIDQIIHLNDQLIGTLFNRAKNRHAEAFHQSGKAINDKVRLYHKIGKALLEARKLNTDPFAAIEGILSWDQFVQSIEEAQKLSQTEDFDYLSLIEKGYSLVRRYAPAFLEALNFKAAPAANSLLQAVEMLKTLNHENQRKIPHNAPTNFIRKRWDPLIFKESGLDRRFYELCVLSELKNALRSGDLWVQGSRQFKDFDEYLLPSKAFIDLKQQNQLTLAIKTDCSLYLKERLALLEQELQTVETFAKTNRLPDAMITQNGLKITPLDNAVPAAAENLMRKAYALLPRVKITELLLEVNNWTHFTKHFNHLKNGEKASDITLLLTTILADAINLGLSKMAESCPEASYAKLTWIQAWYIRDENYSKALAELVNAQYEHPFAVYWGNGTASSSDGQRFRAGSHGEARGQINARYGTEPSILFYTHISDQYAPFHTQIINATVRDATYVLDGLLYHESDLKIEEHYTDTAGFTDHVFALMHMLGFKFAPRIRDLADKRLFAPIFPKNYPTLSCLIGDKLNIKLIETHWDEILRLASSIKQGTVTASLILKKLGGYSRQNGLAAALREIGRIERTLFTLEWLQNKDLRRRVQIGLNKGEAKNALARSIFFNRLGEMRDRSFENQRYRASGLNLVIAAVILWNTVYLERAILALKEQNIEVDDHLLRYLSPLGWEHINLTGDYIWQQKRSLGKGEFRPLNLSEKS